MWARGQKATQLRHLTSSDQRNIPYNTVLSNKSWSKKKKGETFGVSNYITVTCDGTLLSRRRLNTHLLMLRSELIPYFALLVGTAFALLVFISTHEFSHSSDSLCHPTGSTSTFTAEIFTYIPPLHTVSFPLQVM